MYDDVATKAYNTCVCAKVQLNPHLFTAHIAKSKPHMLNYIRPPTTHRCMLLSKLPLQWAIVFHILPAQFCFFIYVLTLGLEWNYHVLDLTSPARELSLVWIVLDFAGALFALWRSDMRAVSQQGRGALDGIKGRRLDAIQSDTACSFIRNMHMAQLHIAQSYKMLN